MKKLFLLLALVALSCAGSASAQSVPNFGMGVPNSAPPQTYWSGPEITTFGDSILSVGGGGNNNFPPTPRAVITGNTHTSTTIDNLSSTVGLQVGAFIFGPTDIQSGTTITAITNTGACPSNCSITISAAATASTTGEALTIPWALTPTSSTGWQVGNTDASAMGWLNALTGNAFTWYPDAGFGQSYRGVISLTVEQGGTGYSNSSTWAPSAGTPTVAAGSATCTAVNGVLQSCALNSPVQQGTNYSSAPAYTCSVGCGSGGLIQWVAGGSGTFAVGGYSTTDMLQTLPNVLARRPAWVIMDGGTNDINSGASFATITGNLGTMLASLNAQGIRVALFKIPNRCTWTGVTGYTAAQAQSTLERVNKWIEAQGRTARYINPSAPGVVVADANRYLTDATNVNGYGLSQWYQNDCLHPGIGGAFWMGVALKSALAPYISPNTYSNFGQDDTYDATYFPGGNLLGTKGLFLGTTGTISITGMTGSVATGWTASKVQGSATVTATAAVNSRTDAPTGNQQNLTFSSVTGGTATEWYRLNIGASSTNIISGFTTTGTIAAGSNSLFVASATNINPGMAIQIDGATSDGTPGLATVVTSVSGTTITLRDSAPVAVSSATVRVNDRIYMSCEVNVSNYVQMNMLGITLTENTTSGAKGIQHAYALDNQVYTGAWFPAYTIVQNMPLQGILPEFVQGASGGGFTVFLATPPIMVQNSTNGYAPSVDVGLDASTGTASATLNVRNCAIRKATQ